MRGATARSLSSLSLHSSFARAVPRTLHILPPRPHHSHSRHAHPAQVGQGVRNIAEGARRAPFLSRERGLPTEQTNKKATRRLASLTLSPRPRPLTRPSPPPPTPSPLPSPARLAVPTTSASSRRPARAAVLVRAQAVAAKTVKIGTRGSPLAMAQAYLTRDLLKVRARRESLVCETCASLWAAALGGRAAARGAPPGTRVRRDKKRRRRRPRETATTRPPRAAPSHPAARPHMPRPGAIVRPPLDSVDQAG